MNKIQKLQQIKLNIYHGEGKIIKEITGINHGIISNYLIRPEKIALKPIYVDKILSAWDMIKENRGRKYES